MVRIRYNRLNIHTNGQVRLLPGLNRITDDAYAAVMNTPGWIDRVKAGIIVVLNAEAAPVPAAAVDGPAPEYDVATLLEDIPHMADVRDLREISGHPNAEVARAAQMRIAEIDAAQRNAEAEAAEAESKAAAEAEAEKPPTKHTKK